MATSEQEIEAAQLKYADLMEEIKTRIRYINAVVSNDISLPARIAEEFCFLQVRMVCETVALGCLIAHGDIEYANSKAMLRAYEAKVILSKLEALRPNFFPRRLKDGQGRGGVRSMEGDDSQEPFTKDELLELHGRCGNYTHRGRLGSLTLMHSQSTNDFIEMAPTMQRLVDLLSYHAIFFTTDRFWLCHLHTKESQAVQVYEMIRAKSPR